MYNFENVEQMVSYLEENKSNEDLKPVFEKFSTKEEIDIEKAKTFIEQNEDGKKYLDSLKDKHFSKGLETWKQNNLDKIVQDKLKELNPQLSPEQLKIKELEDKFNQAQREIMNEKLRVKARDIAREKELPFNVIENLLGEDEETTQRNLETFETTWKEAIQAEVEKRMAGNGRKVHNDKEGNTLTMEDVEKMTEAEINANWDKIQSLFDK